MPIPVTSQGPEIRIGTSGWHYDDWIGRFYPAKTPQGALLDRYVEHFDSVEINNAFHRLPSVNTFANWRDHVPDGFVFACKASRYITHLKKLKDPAASVARFFDAADTLGPKLGPILFQLPPNWRPNLSRLETFLENLPPSHRYAFEFRDTRWFDDAVLTTLERHGCAFCIYDLAGTQAPPEVTADFAYVRLHGPVDSYRGSYDDAALSRWARQFTDWREGGRNVFCYFDNDENAFAAFNAERLRTIMDQG